MNDKLRLLLKSFVDLPNEQVEKFLNISKIKGLKKGEYFIKEGEIPSKIGFNLIGLFRYYYTDSKGNEFTKGFIPENFTVSSYSAMIQKRGSYFYIEALEDSTLSIINYNDLLNLFNQHECWKLFLIKSLERAFIIKENREREFLLLDAESRYKSFLTCFPGLDKRIKQHYIASYLGITQVALSRIRKKMGVVNIG